MRDGNNAIRDFARFPQPGIHRASRRFVIGLLATTLAFIVVPGISPASSDAGKTFDMAATEKRQDSLLADTVRRLTPQRPGITDIYFVAFGGYAHQDVFLREILASSLLLEEQFGVTGRSVLLVNNPATVSHFPLASRKNLGTTVHAIGERLDPREDILFLFLTSHGRPNWLSVDFRPFQLRDLSARELKAILDWSGIKWRIIVVSACYSGSFIDALADKNTLIMTAARRDRTSFGCAHENNFTYFGKAYFDVALRNTHSFTDAFHAARREIRDRERAEGLRPSLPQIALGKAIAPKLDALARYLRSPSANQIADRSNQPATAETAAE